MRAESEGAWLSWDANDLLTLITTWQTGDISKTSEVGALAQGDLAQALAGIKPKALIMPSQSDMLFNVRLCS